MSFNMHYFETSERSVVVAMQHDLEQMIGDWKQLRPHMARHIPAAFTRDEWGYLLAFLEPAYLKMPFLHNFGAAVKQPNTHPCILYRPRGTVAVWLPNNVSLLGPLILILLSLTGQKITIKAGSNSEDLTSSFLQFALEYLPECTLRMFLQSQVNCTAFARTDLRQSEFTQNAQIRIVFGSDTAAEAVHAGPHPLESHGFSFVDRQSEAWLEQAAITDEVLSALIKVFTVYGQAGCTSPKKVVLLHGSATDAKNLRDRLLALWSKTVHKDVPMHTASANIMACQWARTLGWDAECTPRAGAMLACGLINLPTFVAPMGLRIVSATQQEVLAHMPDNIQTIGYALEDAAAPQWLELLATHKIRRFVPLAKMHYFGNIWDGQEFWRQCFEAVEINV